jgi:hypothetical protein
MEPTSRSVPGRGAAGNPPNRFARLWTERDPDWNNADDPAPRAQFFEDASKTIISYNVSPDIGFNASLNRYRGFSAGLDFETKIVVKQNVPELLRRELASPKRKLPVLALSGVTDAYQPVERGLRQLLDDGGELLGRERLEGLRLHESLARLGQREGRSGFIVGPFADGRQVVFAHGDIDAQDLAAGGFGGFDVYRDPVRRTLDGLDTLVRPVVQGEVGGHGCFLSLS